jgi:PKD domain
MTRFASPARLAALTTAVVALLALAPAGATAAQGHNPKGHFLGVVKAGHRGVAAPRALGTGDLTYHGGPVMHSSRTHVVYWDPDGTITAGYKTLVERYLADVAAGSGAFDNVYAVNVQYMDSIGRADYASTFAGASVDSTPYPASGCTDGALTTCLTDAQVTSRLDAFIAANGLPRGTGDVYFVLTPQGVGSCFDSLSSSCAYVDYCAYHSAFASGGQQTIYAMQPWAGVSGCDSPQTPNDDEPADSVVNLISHEHNEAITDPLGDAWFDSAGEENGDKCAWTFGTPLGNTGTGAYNQSIHSNPYYLQREWSNASHSCVLAMDRPPTATFSFAPASPQAGTTVSFDAHDSSDPDGSVVSYSWSFGDGAHSTGAQVGHVYAQPGTYVAQLTVTDNGGVTDVTSQAVTVTAAPAPPSKFETGTPPATQSPPPAAISTARPSVRLLSPVSRVTRARVALVRLSCGAAAACRGSVTIYGRVRAASGRFRAILLGVKSFSLRAGRIAWVRVPLTLRAERLLKSRRRVSVTLRASASGARSVTRSATLTH